MPEDYLCFKIGQYNVLETLTAFSDFAKNLKKAGKNKGRIIELGTAWGGFSVFLALYCIFLGHEWKFYTFDNGDRLENHAQQTLDKLGSAIFAADIFSENTTALIKDLIQADGTTVLLCDNGNKIKEFNLFSKYLKSGDYIFAHDLGAEIRERNVEEICKKQGIVPYMPEVFNRVLWMSKRKK